MPQPVGVLVDVGERHALGADVPARERVVRVATDGGHLRTLRTVLDGQLEATDRLAQVARGEDLALRVGRVWLSVWMSRGLSRLHVRDPRTPRRRLRRTHYCAIARSVYGMDTTQLLKEVLDLTVLAVVDDEDGYGDDIVPAAATPRSSTRSATHRSTAPFAGSTPPAP